MLQEEGLYVLTSGREWSQVRRQNGRAVCISCALGDQGRLRRTALPPETRDTLMGICDQGLSPGRADAASFVRDVLYEIQRLGYTGVLADWEGIVPNPGGIFAAAGPGAGRAAAAALRAPALCSPPVRRPAGDAMLRHRGSLEEIAARTDRRLRRPAPGHGSDAPVPILHPALPLRPRPNPDPSPVPRQVAGMTAPACFFPGRCASNTLPIWIRNGRDTTSSLTTPAALQRKIQLCRSLGISSSSWSTPTIWP